MENNILVISGFLLSCLISFYLLFNYMDRMYDRLYKKKLYIISYIISVCTLTFINTLQNPMLNIIVYIFLVLFIGESLYTKEKKWRILYNIFFILAAAFIEGIAIVGLGIIYQFLGIEFINADMINVLNITVSKILMVLIYRLVINYLLKMDIGGLEKIQGAFYLGLPVFSIINIYALVILLEDNSQHQILVLISICGIVLLNIMVMEFLEYISKSNRIRSKLKLFEQQSEMQFKYYENIENKYNQSRRILHDMKNHIQTIEGLYKTSEEEVVKKYTSEISMMIDELGYKYYSRNKILNIILNDKIQLANQLGIEFQCDVDDVDLGFIADFDMTTIFGNLLDNSIEECRELKVNRKIEFKVNQFHNFIVINITNPLRNKPTIKKGKIVTNKADHKGIGLSNVKNTVEKYNGDLNIYHNNAKFEVNINMSNK